MQLKDEAEFFLIHSESLSIWQVIQKRYQGVSSPSKDLIVETTYLERHFIPSDPGYLIQTPLREEIVKSRIGDESVHRVRHSIYIPVVELDRVGEYLRAS